MKLKHDEGRSTFSTIGKAPIAMTRLEFSELSGFALTSLSSTLAEVGISILAVSTYDTD